MKFRSKDWEEDDKRELIDQRLAREALNYTKMGGHYQNGRKSGFLKQLEKILFSKAVQAIKECITLFALASILYLALTDKLYIKA